MIGRGLISYITRSSAVGTAAWGMSNSSTDDTDAQPTDEDLPYFPGLDPKACKLGRRIVLPIPSSATKQKKYKGGTNIEQEYICDCDKVFTRHTIISSSGKIVHDHFRPGPPKGTLGG